MRNLLKKLAKLRKPLGTITGSKASNLDQSVPVPRRKRSSSLVSPDFVKTNLILFASIALAASVSYGKPTLAFGEIDPADVQEFAASDQNRLTGSVVRAVTRNSPYVDILDGGTMEANMSDTQRVVIQERAVLNQSLVEPVFTLDKEICGQTGEAAEVGSTEYDFTLATNRGKGPLVCIKGMWSSFKTAYTAAENSLKQQLVQLNNADVRITLVRRSGCKLTVKAATGFNTMFAGGMQAIDTPFPTEAGLPNAAPNMKLLQYLGRVLREDLLIEPWEGNQGEPVLRFIGSQEIIDILRDDAGVKENHQYLASGQYGEGKRALLRYRWEGPYRGYTFGVDPQPLRFNVLDGDGQPVFIEPEIATEVSNGVGSRPNPLWFNAKYEVALVMGKRSFTKLAPEVNTGEGSFKFPSQGISGELMWNNIKDNDKNVWQDYGRHFYQFTRAYKPERPHAVTALIFARQQVDFGLSEITNFGDWSYSGSL